MKYSAVDGYEIRYAGSTKYELNYALTEWNRYSCADILPDQLNTLKDLTFSDVSKSSERFFKR